MIDLSIPGVGSRVAFHQPSPPLIPHIVFIMELGLIQIPANLQDKEQFNRPLWTANIKGSDLKAGLRFVTNIDKMEE